MALGWGCHGIGIGCHDARCHSSKMGIEACWNEGCAVVLDRLNSIMLLQDPPARYIYAIHASCRKVHIWPGKVMQGTAGLRPQLLLRAQLIPASRSQAWLWQPPLHTRPTQASCDISLEVGGSWHNLATTAATHLDG